MGMKKRVSDQSPVSVKHAEHLNCGRAQNGSRVENDSLDVLPGRDRDAEHAGTPHACRRATSGGERGAEQRLLRRGLDGEGAVQAFTERGREPVHQILH